MGRAGSIKDFHVNCPPLPPSLSLAKKPSNEEAPDFQIHPLEIQPEWFPHPGRAPRTGRHGYYVGLQKEILSVGEDVENVNTLLHSWWGCKLVQPLWKT